MSGDRDSLQPGIDMRPAAAEDSALILSWANDPAVRQASLSPDAILPEAHERWFAQKLAGEHSLILIGQLDGEPVGQVRFDQDETGVAEIDYSIAGAFRGRRLSAALLEAACVRFLELRVASRIRAHVRIGNERSVRALIAAGFESLGIVERAGQQVHRLERRA